MPPGCAPPGCADNPLVIGSSPPRPRPGSAENPFDIESAPPPKLGASVLRTLTSTRAARQLQAASPAPRQPFPRIIQGPPSSILQIYPAERERARRERLVAADAARSDQNRRLGVPQVVIQSSARTRVRRRQDGAWRAPRENELTLESLLLTGVEPPVQTTELQHHSCGICLHIKSHPVFYTSCGHSHCYTCIRLWLEEDWRCPTCRTRITSPPIRIHDVEQAIRMDHPNWHDTSVVDYSFAGLHFPKP
ncbi:hypothetical protein B0H13DRAFT_2384825 [Mycena leptocephala]|nr:hypothetical protein B0H13DRAFT_2384825 [Mycena leptocephala]